VAAPLVAPPQSPVHNNRLAANKHNSTDPDATAVTVTFIKLPTAVENIGIERPAAGCDRVSIDRDQLNREASGSGRINGSIGS
jgi:hypothetical protein